MYINFYYVNCIQLPLKIETKIIFIFIILKLWMLISAKKLWSSKNIVLWYNSSACKCFLWAELKCLLWAELRSFHQDKFYLWAINLLILSTLIWETFAFLKVEHCNIQIILFCTHKVNRAYLTWVVFCFVK